jgi:aspartate/methionine/tyrosine aminotransferase
LRALFEPGDEIITFAPTYENYFLQTRATGLKLVTVELREPEFGFSIEQLGKAWSDRTRAILICNPCNPTGKVFSEEELQKISDFADHHNLIILSDETYERLIWKGAHVSIASLPAARERTVTIFSMGKTYSVTGWRVGYVVAPDSCVDAIAASHDLTTVAAPHPCQLALAAALELPESFYATTLQRYQERKTTLVRAIRDLGLSPWEPAGSYFLWCDYSSLTSEPDMEFANRLLHQAGVAAVPGKVFYSESVNSHRIRFTFSKSLTTIQQASTRLSAARDLLFAK